MTKPRTKQKWTNPGKMVPGRAQLRQRESMEAFGMTPVFGSAKNYQTEIHYRTDSNGMVIGATGATLTRLGKTRPDVEESNRIMKQNRNGFTIAKYNPNGIR